MCLRNTDAPAATSAKQLFWESMSCSRLIWKCFINYVCQIWSLCLLSYVAKYMAVVKSFFCNRQIDGQKNKWILFRGHKNSSPASTIFKVACTCTSEHLCYSKKWIKYIENIFNYIFFLLFLYIFLKSFSRPKPRLQSILFDLFKSSTTSTDQSLSAIVNKDILITQILNIARHINNWLSIISTTRGLHIQLYYAASKYRK